MKALILDNFISSDKVRKLGPVDQANSGFVSNLAQLNRPELGVTCIPLTRLGTFVPLVAGLRSEGLVELDLSPSGIISTGFDEATEPIQRAYRMVSTVVRDELTNFQRGWAAVLNGLHREAEQQRRAENELRRRGIRMRH